MDVEISMDQDDLLPLLDQTDSPGIQQQHKSHKVRNGWRASVIILGFLFLERMAYFGIAADLVVYLGTVLNGNNASNAANVATWTGTSYLMPLFGAVIADTYLGKYKMIMISIFVFLLGLIMITTSAFTTTLKPSICEANPCNPASQAQNIVFFIGLYLVAIGYGGTKAPLLPFGADQFDDKSAEDRQRKSTFVSLYYASFTFASTVSSTLIVWLQENVGWALGYGVSTLCAAIALAGFVLGTPLYFLQNPPGSPLKSVLQVIVVSFRNRSLSVPIDVSLLHEEANDKTGNNIGRQKLAHTNSCRFLDKAAIPSHSRDQHNSSWKECTVTQVEELKILLRLLPIWAAGIIYSAAYFQMSTTFIQQGHAMNTEVLSFSVPPAALYSIESIIVVVWILVFNSFIMPLTRQWLGNEVGLSQLQRIGIGQLLMVVAMITAAYLEMRRLDSARDGEMLSVSWQLPQYFIIAISEAFNYVAQTEFFYSESPETMKSMCTAFALLTLSLGNYLSSLLVELVTLATTSNGRPGWIPDDLNKGHLDYFFLWLAGLCALNNICFIMCSRKYTPKSVIVKT